LTGSPLFVAAGTRARTFRWIAGICTLVSVARAAAALLPDGPCGTPFVSWAVVAGLAAGSALVGLVQSRPRRRNCQSSTCAAKS
jgi:aminoglycoside phosphotransferase (APT) family kinase protein